MALTWNRTFDWDMDDWRTVAACRQHRARDVLPHRLDGPRPRPDRRGQARLRLVRGDERPASTSRSPPTRSPVYGAAPPRRSAASCASSGWRRVVAPSRSRSPPEPQVDRRRPRSPACGSGSGSGRRERDLHAATLLVGASVVTPFAARIARSSPARSATRSFSWASDAVVNVTPLAANRSRSPVGRVLLCDRLAPALARDLRREPVPRPPPPRCGPTTPGGRRGSARRS